VTEEPTEETIHAPHRFGHLPGYGKPGIIRRPWKQPCLVPGSIPGWCCQCVEKNARAAWDESAAPYILCESEWRIWHGLPQAAARCRWLRGRVAAKDAVRLLILERYRMVASLETIGILPDGYGKPGVLCDALPNTGTGICVSISHCGNTSVALATECSESCRGVGIDVASQTDNHDGLAEGGFASAETLLLDDVSPHERNDWLLRLWCAKEAVGKALGLGLMGNPLNYVVLRIDRARRSVDVETTGWQGSGATADPTMITAHVGCDRGMAFAVARQGES
jgi:phosphopantetheinyl transferase